MHYKATELQQIFLAEQKKERETLQEKGLDRALQELSEAMDELRNIGIDTHLVLKNGGSDLSFMMAKGYNVTCNYHGYFNIGNQNYILGIFTRVGEEDCLQMRVSVHDLEGKNKAESMAHILYDLTSEEALKDFQKSMVEAAVSQELIRENDKKNVFSMPALTRQRRMNKRRKTVKTTGR